MPEGPEIALEADRIRDAIEGKAVCRVRFAFDVLEGHASAFEGSNVDAVKARGKAMLIGFDNGLTIYSHNQLYGRWYVRRAGQMPSTRRQLRLAIETPDHWALLYSASEIDVLDRSALEGHPYLSRLGPDALDDDLSMSAIEDRLRDRRFARRSLGALLLDQGFVAGLGNYLRSEICFEARVHPGARPIDLDRTACRRIARAVLRISRRAYATRGVTQPKARFDRAIAAGERRTTARHFVFARAGEPCRCCEASVERLTLAGRRAYVCASCQPFARKGATR